MKMNGETTLSTVPRLKRPEPEKANRESARQPILSNTASTAWTDEISADDLAQVLARRAAQIAQVVEENNLGEQIELAIIALGREVYGIEVQYVFNIRPVEHLTHVPRVPAWVAGVVNLRGNILSVLDLSKYLGLPMSDQPVNVAKQRLVVVRTLEMELALLVDEVLAIESFPLASLQEATGVVRGLRPEHVRGILVDSRALTGPSVEKGDEGAGMLVVLDLPVLLADKRLIVHEDITG